MYFKFYIIKKKPRVYMQKRPNNIHLKPYKFKCCEEKL